MPAQPQEQIVPVGDRSILLHEIGAGSVVLMLHGGGPGANGLSNYSRAVEDLATRFRVLVPDMRAIGPRPRGWIRTTSSATSPESMVGLLDALGIETAHVVGKIVLEGLEPHMSSDRKWLPIVIAVPVGMTVAGAVFLYCVLSTWAQDARDCTGRATPICARPDAVMTGSE